MILMAKKPQSRNSSSKTSIKKNTNYKPVLITALIAAALAIIVVLIWPLIRNNTLYSVDKDEVRADITSILDKMNPPGELVYSDIVDLGCDSGGSVGLHRDIRCNLMGYKYFTYQGDVGETLQAFDATLEKNGWHKNDDLPDKNHKTLTGQEEGSVFYWRNSRSWAAIDVEFYQINKKINNVTIRNLVDNNKITLNSSTNIFGLRISQTYWACNSQSFRLPCPTPPSKASP